MANEFDSASYELARQKRRPTNPLKRSAVLPPSDKKTLTPKYLLQHENHADPNVVTPEQLIDKGVLRGSLDSIQKI